MKQGYFWKASGKQIRGEGQIMVGKTTDDDLTRVGSLSFPSSRCFFYFMALFAKESTIGFCEISYGVGD